MAPLAGALGPGPRAPGPDPGGLSCRGHALLGLCEAGPSLGGQRPLLLPLALAGPGVAVRRAPGPRYQCCCPREAPAALRRFPAGRSPRRAHVGGRWGGGGGGRGSRWYAPLPHLVKEWVCIVHVGGGFHSEGALVKFTLFRIFFGILIFWDSVCHTL